MKASELYHHPKHLFNCAQSIIYKWSEINGIASLKAVDFRSNGGGRTPDGICGALYAALLLFDRDSDTQDQLKTEFVAAIGSPLCRSIRLEKLATCKECINFVDEWVEKSCSISI